MSAELEKLLGYRFEQIALLEQALTHKSFGKPNNERLEFLGDSVLGFVVAQLLFEQHPNAQEDELSLIRAHLVRGSTLAEVAVELQLGTHLRMGSGELKSGGRQRGSILADAFEAVLGAIVIDGGYQACADVLRRLFAQRVVDARAEELKDPKTRLQEYLQGLRYELPEYVVIAAEGKDHARSYTVRCQVEEPAVSAEAVAGSRRSAEQQAALKVLNMLLDAAPGNSGKKGNKRSGSPAKSPSAGHNKASSDPVSSRKAVGKQSKGKGFKA